MALDPRLSLAVQVPDVSRAFNNALLNVQGVRNLQESQQQAPLRNRLLEAQTGAAEAGVAGAEQLNKIRSLALFGSELQSDIQSGDLQSIRAKTVRRIGQDLPSQGLPSTESQQLLQLIDNPNISEQDKITQIGQLAQRANQAAIQFGAIKAPSSTGLASAKTEFFPDGSSIQGLPSGETIVKDPSGRVVTGQERVDTLKASTRFGLDVKQQESDIAVRQAERTAQATQRAKRVSQITTELSERNRAAKRGAINLSQAATLVEQAQQGVTGAGKVRLAKLFPDIDVGSEAALSQSLTNLALDELQKFKGPTTDFEFQKTEQIAGTLGDSQSANRAKVASLQRANWFVQREFKQFQDHIKTGKSPDTFGFNFGEQIKTKKGEFSLQDLQDTAVSNNISIEETIKRLNR